MISKPIKEFLQKSVTIAQYSFIPEFEVSEELNDYIFLNFFRKDNTQLKNDRNKEWWKFLITLASFNAQIKEFTYQSDYHYLEPDSEIISELNSWNVRGSFAYIDLLKFLKKHINLGMTYPAALGFWILWNMKGSIPTHEETKTSSEIGAFIVTLVKLS